MTRAVIKIPKTVKGEVEVLNIQHAAFAHISCYSPLGQPLATVALRLALGLVLAYFWPVLLLPVVTPPWPHAGEVAGQAASWPRPVGRR
jgi:hypothetical protein